MIPFSKENGVLPNKTSRKKREADSSEGIGYIDDIVNIDYPFIYDLPNTPSIHGWVSPQAELQARQLCDGKLNEIRTKFPACVDALKDITTESCMEDVKVTI